MTSTRVMTVPPTSSGVRRAFGVLLAFHRNLDMNGRSFDGALSITQLPPRERTRSDMVVSPKPLGVSGAMPLPSSLRIRAKRGAAAAWRRAAAAPAFSARSMVRVARFAVADGIGDALLDAAIEREVDRLAIGFGKLADRDGEYACPGGGAGSRQ